MRTNHPFCRMVRYFRTFVLSRTERVDVYTYLPGEDVGEDGDVLAFVLLAEVSLLLVVLVLVLAGLLSLELSVLVVSPLPVGSVLLLL
jgi:hypothetical protein